MAKICINSNIVDGKYNISIDKVHHKDQYALLQQDQKLTSWQHHWIQESFDNYRYIRFFLENSAGKGGAMRRVLEVPVPIQTGLGINNITDGYYIYMNGEHTTADFYPIEETEWNILTVYGIY